LYLTLPCFAATPVAHWALDETSGVTAYDSVGNNDGTLINGPVWTTGQIGGAFSFDGIDDYIKIIGYKGILGAQSRTTAAWIKTAGDGVIMKWGGGQPGSQWSFWLKYSGIQGALSVSVDSGYIFGSTILSDNQWHHVAAVLEDDGSPNADEIKLYVDGVQESDCTIASQPIDTQSLADLQIGVFGTILHFPGLIDDVRIYDCALSSLEIRQIYFEGRSGLSIGSLEDFDSSGKVGGPFTPASKVYQLSNNSSEVISWEAAKNEIWLDIDTTSGVLDPNESVDVTISLNSNADSFSRGIYTDTITFSDITDPSDVINQTVDVVLQITEIALSPYWKNQIDLPDDPFFVQGTSDNDPGWIKFTSILKTGYDPNIVYYQDSVAYPFHYNFATERLDPFIGMSVPEYFDVALYETGQEASLGAVIVPYDPAVLEYGIQLIRLDPYTKEQIVEMFNHIKTTINAPGYTAYYFPTYEQYEQADIDRDWLLAQGVTVGTIAQWTTGNICYSPGWALGELKFFPGDQIQSAYLSGDLLPEDVLLTDGIPAEIPFVAGIVTLSPTTPNSHVAILAQTYGVPLVYLAEAADIDSAQQMLGLRTLICVEDLTDYCNVRFTDVDQVFSQNEIDDMLALKEPAALNISPTAIYGAYTSSTDSLLPADIQHFGGKAANYGMLRQAIPDNSPEAIAISFDLWNEFLDQPIVPRNSITIAPNSFELFWADRDIAQGSNHADFKLDDEGEYIGLYDKDGTTLIDGLSFGLQTNDISYGRSIDGGETWHLFGSGTATPGSENSPGSSSGNALVINEFMAENDSFIQDAFGEYDDWFELYNASGVTIDLGGIYLTDDPDDPTAWMIPPSVTGSTLRQEIANRLSGYTYPPSDMAALSEDLSAIRSLFKNTLITSFTPAQILAIETDLQNNFDANEKIRFRSSTNVEDSEEFSGAGLYDSYSGCLADDLDGNEDGPCICDPTKSNERGVFRAIRKVFASFYNDNAFLERLRYDIDPNEVGMALLVHHSFPDEIELANGVATVQKQVSETDFNIKLVTQLGAISVANPEDGSIPEEVTAVYQSDLNIDLTLVRSSNLVILGDKVMDWQADYSELSRLLVDAAERFELVTGKNEYILDFEYKKVAPGGTAVPAGGLVVKQIRQVPKPDTESLICPSASCDCPVNGVFIERTYDGDGVSIETSYCLSCPPGMICKIADLTSWCRTVIRGYTTKPIVLVSDFSQGGYSAGWHNWCESFSFMPHLEPGMDQCTLNQLRALDIRQISLYNMTACGTPYISLLGFGGAPFYLGDFEPDGDVDLVDIAVFAQKWLEIDCGQCGGADLNCDGDVNLPDFGQVAENWFVGTSP